MKLIDPPDGRPWALLALAGASLFLNVVLGAMLLLDDASPPESRSPVSAAIAEQPDAVAVAEAQPAEGAQDVPQDEPVEAVDLAAADVSGEIHVLEAKVQHSLARTFQSAAGSHADVVSAVYARLFVWDLDLRRDLQRGDTVQVAYTWDGELAHIPVATYTSSKHGRTFRAYRHKIAGDAWPSWWTEDGVEVPRRLVNGPLRGQYEQVTSLLKDRPSHKGMDFKVPEGTPVVTPLEGAVVRTNWNLAYNGNCVEVRFSDGTVARFLHLSRTDVTPGQKLAAGTVVGLSGNTGRSTAPHLHYELERNGKVVDPVEYHGVTRRQLPESERESFRAVVRQYDRLLASAS